MFFFFYFLIIVKLSETFCWNCNVKRLQDILPLKFLHRSFSNFLVFNSNDEIKTLILPFVHFQNLNFIPLSARYWTPLQFTGSYNWVGHFALEGNANEQTHIRFLHRDLIVFGVLLGDCAELPGVIVTSGVSRWFIMRNSENLLFEPSKDREMVTRKWVYQWEYYYYHRFSTIFIFKGPPSRLYFRISIFRHPNVSHALYLSRRKKSQPTFFFYRVEKRRTVEQQATWIYFCMRVYF